MNPNTKAKSESLSDADIEKLAVEHEAFGFGRVDAKGYTTHGFDPDGLRDFAAALLKLAADRRLTAEQSPSEAWVQELLRINEQKKTAEQGGACPICFEEVPGTGSCGSSSPRAHCNIARAALTTQPQAEPPLNPDHLSAGQFSHGELAALKARPTAKPARDAELCKCVGQEECNGACYGQSAQPQAEPPGGCKVVRGTPCNSPTVCAAYGCTHDSKAQPQAEPAADTARLDWLQATQKTIWTASSETWHPVTDGTNRREMRSTFEGWCAASSDDPKPTIREAIDAARAIATPTAPTEPT